MPNADFVIEGYVDPTEPLRDEGPFGDHTGYYPSEAKDSPTSKNFVAVVASPRILLIGEASADGRR